MADDSPVDDVRPQTPVAAHPGIPASAKPGRLSGGIALAEPTASHPRGQFIEPWMRRVRDVDDDTLAGLLKTLVTLRRLKLAVAGGAALVGALLFGFMEIENPLYAALIYGTLAACVGLPVFAGGSLAVRRLFLQEAQRQGLAKSTSTLVLTRAERRARLLSPWKSEDEKIDLLLQAVRDPDLA